MTTDMNVDEIRNVEMIIKTVRASEDYSFIRECTFGELIINAENPYAIKRLSIVKSGLAERYQQSLFEAVKNEELDQTLLKKINLGFDFTNLPEEIANPNSRLYVLDLEDLREVYPE